MSADSTDVIRTIKRIGARVILTPNENKISHRWRERATQQVEMWKSSQSWYQNGQPLAASAG
jgi:hypothetical protein